MVAVNMGIKLCQNLCLKHGFFLLYINYNSGDFLKEKWAKCTSLYRNTKWGDNIAWRRMVKEGLVSFTIEE